LCASPAERAIPRPSLPPLVWSALALALGLFAAETLVWRLGAGRAAVTCAIAAESLVCACALASTVRRHRTAALCAVALGVGLAVGVLFWVHLSQVRASLAEEGRSRWEVAVVSDAVEGEYGASSDVRVRTGARGWVAMSASWPKGARPPEAGATAIVYGAHAIQGDPAKAEQQFREGSAGSLRVRRIDSTAWSTGLTGIAARLRSWAIGRIGTIPGDGSALLASALLGDRRRLRDTQVDTDMKVAGLAHFEATSGYHLLLVGAVVETLLLGAGLGRRSRAVLGLAMTGVFVLLCGGRTSVARGWVMAALARGGWQAARRADAVSGLALCAAVMLCATPAALFDMGFQLSVLAVAAILVFARLAEGWACATLPPRFRRVSGPIAVTLCAVAATIPLSAPVFGFVSLVAPVSNLFAAPLVVGSLIAGLAGLVLSSLLPGLGAVALRVAAAFAAMLGSLAGAFARVPFASIPATANGVVACAGLAAAAALWAWWPQPRRDVGRFIARVAVAGALVVVLPLPSVVGPRIVVMDVGQGDAILVSDSGHDVLVDTGPTGPALLGALARQHVRRLDGVVITHLHADHYGGLAAAESVLHVPAVYVPEGTLGGSYAVVDAARESVGESGLRELGVGDTLRVGSFTLDVVSPLQPVADAATNEASVVIVARRGGQSVLLTGDAEEQVLQAAVDAGSLGDIDVLKVGHHGSAISMSPALLEELTPCSAVISLGAGNRYGHPKAAALEMLRTQGVPTYRTDLDGDVTIKLGGHTPAVRPTRKRASYVASRAKRPAMRLGAPPQPCATLFRTNATPAQTPETHVSDALRPQARLPHLRDRGPPAPAGAGAAEEARGRCRGPRLQLRHV
jgi:competence protein ComEC